MRHTTAALLAVCLLLAGAAVGCSKSYDDIVADCVTALKAPWVTRTSPTPART